MNRLYPLFANTSRSSDYIQRHMPLLEQMGDLVLAFDEAGELIYTNAAALTWLGGAETAAAQAAPLYPQATWQQWQAAPTPAARPPQDWRPQTAGGAALTGRLYPLHDDVQDLIGLLAVGQANPAPGLPDPAEGLFRAVFDNALEAMILFDNADQYIDVNPAACALLGLPRAELMTRRFSSFTVPGMEMVFAQAMQYFLTQGQLRGEFQIQTENGAIREVEFIATANCLPGQHLAIMRDITERKLADQALRRSEERFSKAFRANPTGIMIARRGDGQVLDANASWLQIAGYSREEVIGQTVDDLNLWADTTEGTQVSTLLQTQGFVREMEVHFRQKSEEVRLGSLSVDLIEVGGEPCLLIMGRDVTERKLMEERIRAVERLGALGRVAAGVAHEFNNTLAGIMGRLDLLALQVHDLDALATLRLIQQAVEDSATMVQRVQNFGRLRNPSSVRIMPVSELVNDVVSLTQARWRTSPDPHSPGITLHTEIDQGLLVQGDPTELREVLTNLIFNAVDALPQGGQIAIVAEPQGADTLISIRDTGTGIDPALHERVFEPFFTTKIGGSGLGLSVVKDVVQSHGGRIEMVSLPGSGTTFNITLPPAPALPLPPPAPVPRPAAQAARILTVDDDPRLGDMLRLMLAVHGHQVTVATSGAEALALLDQQPFDLVCTDLGMPGMNGWEVARQVRLRAPGTPIILVTGWDVQLDSAEMAAQIVDGVLTKPYRLAQVEALVTQVLERRTPDREP